jgi:hypothetical protein
MGARMSATGRWVPVADGVGDGDTDTGETGASSVAAGTGSLAALLGAGAAVPLTGVGALGVVPTAGAAALAVGTGTDLTGVDCVVLETAGVADTADVAVTVGVAAPVGAAAAVVAVDSGGVAVPDCGDWLSDDVVDWSEEAVDWSEELALVDVVP